LLIFDRLFRFVFFGFVIYWIFNKYNLGDFVWFMKRNDAIMEKIWSSCCLLWMFVIVVRFNKRSFASLARAFGKFVTPTNRSFSWGLGNVLLNTSRKLHDEYHSHLSTYSTLIYRTTNEWIYHAHGNCCGGRKEAKKDFQLK